MLNRLSRHGAHAMLNETSKEGCTYKSSSSSSLAYIAQSRQYVRNKTLGRHELRVAFAPTQLDISHGFSLQKKPPINGQCFLWVNSTTSY